MRKGFFRIWLSAAAVSLLLTGCAGKAGAAGQTALGMQALEENDPVGAQAYFEAAEQAGEDPVLLYRGLGMSMMGQARYAEAAEAFRKALEAADEKMPQTVRDISLYLADAEYELKDYDAVADLCTDLMEEPSAEAACLLGAAYLARDDRENARASFDKAVSLAPGDYSLYLRIYEYYEDHNLTAIGDEYLQTALGIMPENDEDRCEIGRIYYCLEQYNEAREVLEPSVETGYRPAYELMGEIYLKLGDYTRAVGLFQSVLDEDGETPSACNGMALCALASGDYDEAIRWIEEGLALDEEEGKEDLRFNEIVAYERKLDFATALVKAEAYCELYPADAEGRKELTFLRTR